MAFGSDRIAKETLDDRQPTQSNRGRGGRIAGNLALLMALWVAGVVLVHVGGPQRHAGLAEGQRAPATVVAAVDFNCVNVAATELLRRQAAESVVPVFSIQMGPLQAARRSLEKLADRIIALRSELEAVKPDAKGAGGNAAKALEKELAVVADLLGLAASGEAIAKLFPPGKEMDVLTALKDSLSAVWMNGILSEEDRESRFQGLTQSTTIDIVQAAEAEGRAYRTVDLDELPAIDKALETYRDEALKRLAALGMEAAGKTVEDLARSAMRPNLDYEERATEERRMAAQRGVEPATMVVRAGTTLMEEGATVAPQTVEMIEAYNRRMAKLEVPRERRMRQMGDAALMLIVLAVCVGWLGSTQPMVYALVRRKLLLAFLGLLAIGMVSLYHYMSAGLSWIPPWLVPFAIPIALPTMLAALLLGPAAALAVGLWSGLSAALVFGRSYELLLLGLGGSALATWLLRNVRKRAQVMRAGLLVGLFASLLALAAAAMVRQTTATFLIQMGTGLASGLFAAVVTLLLLPFLEWLFRRTTGISLLELTDMGHPLLQRLALEAPGTYHHSLMVGAIGQAAANRIGADGLLVLVGAYFHDIGKLAKPEFFSENQRGGDNPHDSLAPSMSALVIQSHVKEGLTLAKRYKLPRPVCDAIRLHHGTSLTSYFYHVARHALREAGQTEDAGLEHSFRYDGPKPRTREQAILMLADTVEAASRSLEKPAPNRIAEMVETLMREKLLDGQLDHCPLTLEDLHEIRNSFVFTLTNVLHGRNPYPRENPLVQPPAGAENPSVGVPEAGADIGEAGVSR